MGELSSGMISRSDLATEVDRALAKHPVVALVGPRQCGKTTLARTRLDPRSENYFDLERPADAQRLRDPMLAIQPLRGLVVIDEVQHAPEVFRSLRVLADERPLRRRVLVLGSASPTLLQQTSESLAGRVRVVEMGGFTLRECGDRPVERRWLRGGLPRAYLARSARDSMEWLDEFIDTIARRDIPSFGLRLAATESRRLLSMLAHYHGQTLNASSIAKSLGISPPTVRSYVDLLMDLFHVRQLQPWHANVAKRQVRSPKILIRDSGMLHRLLAIGGMAQLLRDPRLGASWEGFVIEEILAGLRARRFGGEAYWWSTHQEAELDLLLVEGRRRVGVEIKRSDAPGMTRSIAIAMEDLELEAVTIVAPVEVGYDVAAKVRVVPFSEIAARPELVLEGPRSTGAPRRRPKPPSRNAG